MPKPDNIGFIPNVILLTGLTLSGLIPMFFIGDGDMAGFTPSEPQAKAEEISRYSSGTMAVAAAPQAAEKNNLGALYKNIQGNTAMPMPVGFDGQWSPVALDGGKISLQVLKKPYALNQTQNRAGAEFFDYASYLYLQMGQQVDDQTLREKFKRLSGEADAMARHMREASALRFDGAPTEGMEHMTVRTGILSHLGNLNSRGVTMVNLDESGNALSSQNKHSEALAGQSLKRFRHTLSEIITDPGFRKHYPQTLRVVQSQAGVLEDLAMSMEVRWESVFDCEGQCPAEQAASRMRIYAVQTARATDVKLATESAIYQWLGYSPRIT